MIYSRAKIEYGYGLEADQRELIVNDGVNDISIIFDIGFFSRDLFLQKINEKLTSLGLPLSVVHLADNTFQFIGLSSFTVVGGSASVILGLSNVTEFFEFGKYYLPPFLLQSYLSEEDNEALRYPSQSISACGLSEVLYFGSEKKVEFDIQYEGKGECGQLLNGSVAGLDKLRDLMSYMIRKRPVEFYPDKDLSDKIILELEKTKDGGHSFRLYELYSEGLPDLYKTDILTFRVINEECSQ